MKRFLRVKAVIPSLFVTEIIYDAQRVATTFGYSFTFGL